MDKETRKILDSFGLEDFDGEGGGMRWWMGVVSGGGQVTVRMTATEEQGDGDREMMVRFSNL
jgi:hypothetical protein